MLSTLLWSCGPREAGPQGSAAPHGLSEGLPPLALAGLVTFV